MNGIDPTRWIPFDAEHLHDWRPAPPPVAPLWRRVWHWLFR